MNASQTMSKQLPSQPHKNSPPPCEPCPPNQFCKAAYTITKQQISIKLQRNLLHNKKLMVNTARTGVITLRESLTKCQTVITFITNSSDKLPWLSMKSTDSLCIVMAARELLQSQVHHNPKLWSHYEVLLAENFEGMQGSQECHIPKRMTLLTPTHSPSFLALGTEIRLTLCSEQSAWTSLE